MINAPIEKKTSKPIQLVLLMLLTAIILSACPFIGPFSLSFDDLVMRNHDAINTKILWQMRIPRTLVAFTAGGVFALCGMVFQAMFRNPLVSPSTLGVSIGASFGASIYIWTGLSFAFWGISGISFFAFLGALLSILIVWSLSKIKFGTSTAKMLLAGVAISFFFASLIMFIQYMSDITQSFQITRWLMGGLFVFGYRPVLDIIPFGILAFVMIWYFSNELNLLTTGEEIAISRGVDLNRLIKILFILISILIGGVVAIVGPIAFVGIIAPHICRLLIGFDHRYLTPATFLFGGAFLIVCDTIARTVAAPAEIPIGVITALLGGPFFLWLLCTKYAE